ncbi:uncharacterized protein M6B38_142500 [Iris pallida]|uniref:Uncharacterized protein n=1 Tax=Iris pallida TaxID=29817 RepID=A0AAX6FBU3_IRIPA|nr:uncharacterized protein M6B38_142500 [Iris pallida]
MMAQQNRPVPAPGPSASAARRQRATTNSFLSLSVIGLFWTQWYYRFHQLRIPGEFSRDHS